MSIHFYVLRKYFLLDIFLFTAQNIKPHWLCNPDVAVTIQLLFQAIQAA